MPGVEICPACGGVFADSATSQRILTRLDRALLAIGFDAGAGKPRAKDDGQRLPCPHCLVPMHRTPVPAAACVVDACALHGTWFDAGELEAVMRAFGKRKKGQVPPGAASVTYQHDTESYSPVAHFVGQMLIGPYREPD